MKGIYAALTVLALGASSAAALTAHRSASITAEAERTAQGAKVSITGKGWDANARVKLMGTRPPAVAAKQDFGTVSADATGSFKFQKTIGCTTSNMDDARDPVTITATDSATSASVSKKVEAGAWICN